MWATLGAISSPRAPLKLAGWRAVVYPPLAVLLSAAQPLARELAVSAPDA